MLKRVYDANLIEKWKRALQQTFGFRSYMDLLIQPSFGKNYLTYVPLLTYTDRTSQQIDDLLELVKDNHYQIRTLNFDTKNFQQDDTVTLRIDCRGKDIEEIQKGYKRLARRHINKEQRLDRYTLKEDKKYLDIFYEILKDIYHKHGTPILPKAFLENLRKNLAECLDIFILFDRENRPVGGVLFFYNNGIATAQYGGMLHRYNDASTGYFMYHKIIEYLLQKKGIDIIDFGRSPYGGGTYFFKTRFGAEPIKIDIHTSDKKNIYEVYSLASKIWRRLPPLLTDSIGPKLTKYLVDL